MLTFLRTILRAAAGAGHDACQEIREGSLAFAASGPASAVASLFALGLIDEIDAQFQVLEAYYLHEGRTPVPSRHTAAELSLNEQHRRLTQVLFTPVLQKARDDARFMKLCGQIGLVDYWSQSGLNPDFLGS